MLAFRSVQQGNHCAREEFLYELKAGRSTQMVHLAVGIAYTPPMSDQARTTAL